ncbi:MAG TPA: ATPase, T2SS/T4P/T4SS family [Longimicrobiales bacterium]|nr:ATPase, T2SS/T4P/T4SS family [Longimicrobiales bacterium]
MIATQTPGPLGRMLVAAGAIDDGELAAALEEQRRTGERLGQVLHRRGLDAEALARTLARQLRLPYLAPPLQPHANALALVDGALAARLRIIPLSSSDRVVRVAMADPLDLATLEDLRFRTGRRVEAVVASPGAVEAALVVAYHSTAVSEVLTRLPGNGAGGPPAAPAELGRGTDTVDSLRRASEAPPVVALVELLLAKAVQQRASDIHIEPVADGMRVRARVDGVMRELMTLPAHSRGAVVSRIKVMADLDIAVKRRPQDGRGAVRVQGRELALRVSTLPTQGGEKVVLRLLDSSNAGQKLASLDMTAEMHARFRRLLVRSHGVLLVTGPTGSGKTTTLYAALAALDRERLNVITLEDPVEYRLPGLTQVQVQRKAGLSFAAGLRAVLRQDPDVVMLGELRDRETVEIALAAALTGHLVLSTLHTNDAASAPARLYEMGAPPYLVAGGLIGVLAQRLARRLCVHCRAQRTVRGEDLEALGLPPRPLRAFAAVGCHRCEGTGFRGRVGVYELLVVTPAMRERIVRRAPAAAIADTARVEGTIPLAQDAWMKVRQGLTTPGEVAPLLVQGVVDATPCPLCAAPVKAAFMNCPACGAALRRRCACGARLQEEWRHCTKCGAPGVSPATPPA